jgi:hypothetical protein
MQFKPNNTIQFKSENRKKLNTEQGKPKTMQFKSENLNKKLDQ